MGDSKENAMKHIEGCQMPCLPRIAEDLVYDEDLPFVIRIKRSLAKPWNYYYKSNLKVLNKRSRRLRNNMRKKFSRDGQSLPEQKVASSRTALKTGDLVRVKSKDEIESTLDRWNELKGCAFLVNMEEYCGTTQRVLQHMERFLDERDYKVKRSKGLILLEGVICTGTPVFGRCDRCCHLFWREEWLEKIG